MLLAALRESDTEAAHAEVNVLFINRWPNTSQTHFDTYTDFYCEGLRGFYALTERQVLHTHKQDANRIITFSDCCQIYLPLLSLSHTHTVDTLFSAFTIMSAL